MCVVHLMASPFVGGPERQVLGLARYAPSAMTSIFLSFAERGLAQPFLDLAQQSGFAAKALVCNTPQYFACVSEIMAELRRLKPDVLCCHGYKPNLVGWQAARRVGIPVVAVSHGWTAATWKVRCYETLDRMALRWMDAVVCVSKSQAEKVRRVRVPESKIIVIQNGKGDESFVAPNPVGRQEMQGWFAKPRRWIIGAAGRLSPEKGYTVFIEAAAQVVALRPESGFVIFGEGPLRCELERLIRARGLQGSLILAGFKTALQRYLPTLDVHVMSSFTEGLPNVLLEAGAAGVPTVATAVGGIPEVIDNGKSGYLVPPGDATALARCIVHLLDNEEHRTSMGQESLARVRHDFSFTEMSRQYFEVFQRLMSHRSIGTV